jgi:hypothetical protein
MQGGKSRVNRDILYAIRNVRSLLYFVFVWLASHLLCAVDSDADECCSRSNAGMIRESLAVRKLKVRVAFVRVV